MTAARPFDWRDGERSIHFGRGRLAEAVELVGGPGFTLLTTTRAAADSPALVRAAAAVHEVPAGRVDELAGALLDQVDGARLVALGGGRVIDVGKALAAARGGSATVAAVPTTLSGAEMTRGHRHATGVDPATRRVRPAVVVCDPALAASQPAPDMAASSLNALGHCAEAPLTPGANPVSTLAAHDGARRIALAFAGDPDTEGAREELALAALLAGYSIDSAGYGLHHVLAQTLARAGGATHAGANSVLLPHSLRALAERFPDRHAALADAMGGDPSEIAGRICTATGATTLRELGVERGALRLCADAAARRESDLAATPPAATRDEILALYEAAY